VLNASLSPKEQGERGLSPFLLKDKGKWGILSPFLLKNKERGDFLPFS